MTAGAEPLTPGLDQHELAVLLVDEVLSVRAPRGLDLGPTPGGTCADTLPVVGSITLTWVALSKASWGEPLEMSSATWAPLGTFAPAAGTVPATWPIGRGRQLLDRLGDEPQVGQRLRRLGGVGRDLGDGDRAQAGLRCDGGQAARARLARGGGGRAGGAGAQRPSPRRRRPPWPSSTPPAAAGVGLEHVDGEARRHRASRPAAAGTRSCRSGSAAAAGRSRAPGRPGSASAGPARASGRRARAPSTFPVPVTTTTSTTVPFLAFAPAAGLWSMTLPAFCLGTTLLVVFPSLSPILLSSFCAANALGCPLRFGTDRLLGQQHDHHHHGGRQRAAPRSTSTTAATAAGGTWPCAAAPGPSVPTGVAVSWN